MNKIFLLTGILIFGLTSINAQGNLNAGVSPGLPVSATATTFNITLDVSYLWDSGESFKVGLATGFSNSFGKTTDNGIGFFDFPDIQFLPIAGAIRFAAFDKLILGVDLGHALGINDGNKGGFYYAPRVQYAISEIIGVVFSFRGVDNNESDSFDVLNLGVEFRL
jgi:hypothetical protein